MARSGRRGLRPQNTNEIPRSWASNSLAFFRLTRSKKGSTPRRFLLCHPISPTSCRSAQDDLLKWGDICYFDRRGDSRIALGVPFVRRHVAFGSLREGAPARAGGGACETKDGALVFLKAIIFLPRALPQSATLTAPSRREPLG